jgi:hypothetical protein
MGEFATGLADPLQLNTQRPRHWGSSCETELLTRIATKAPNVACIHRVQLVADAEVENPSSAFLSSP